MARDRDERYADRMSAPVTCFATARSLSLAGQTPDDVSRLLLGHALNHEAQAGTLPPGPIEDVTPLTPRIVGSAPVTDHEDREGE